VKMFDAGKTRMIGLPYGEKSDDMLSRFHLIPERNGQTAGQTDLLYLVWLSGNTLASINVVALRQTGWVTVCGRVNHLGMYPAS